MDLFPFGRDLSNPFFTEHALNVVNALDFAIKKLDNTAQLIPKLEELGRVHAPFELSTKEFDVRRFELCCTIVNAVEPSVSVE